MFFAVIKTTVKNLIRSVTFWLTLGILAVIVFESNMSRLLTPNEFGFISYDSYGSLFNNILVPSFLMYAMPIFAVITTVLTLNRDYGDKFFEIEKASGITPLSYTAGRIIALLAVNSGILFVLSSLLLYLRVICAGGVEGMTFGYFLVHSLSRLLFVNIFLGIPHLLFYIGLTYAVGCIFKNGIPAMVFSTVYVMFYYVVYLLYRHQFIRSYFEYYAPIPRALRHFLDAYCGNNPQASLQMYGIDFGDAFHGFAFLVGFGLICMLIAYQRLRKRTV